MTASFAVLWTRTAESDLRSVISRFSAESPEAALKVLERIEERAARLGNWPLRGRVVPELAEHAILAYRELVVPPWRVVYRIDGRKVWIVAVLDSRRSLEDLLLERFLR